MRGRVLEAREDPGWCENCLVHFDLIPAKITTVTSLSRRCPKFGNNWCAVQPFVTSLINRHRSHHEILPVHCFPLLKPVTTEPKGRHTPQSPSTTILSNGERHSHVTSSSRRMLPLSAQRRDIRGHIGHITTTHLVLSIGTLIFFKSKFYGQYLFNKPGDRNMQIVLTSPADIQVTSALRPMDRVLRVIRLGRNKDTKNF